MEVSQLYIRERIRGSLVRNVGVLFAYLYIYIFVRFYMTGLEIFFVTFYFGRGLKTLFCYHIITPILVLRPVARVFDPSSTVYNVCDHYVPDFFFALARCPRPLSHSLPLTH